MLALKESKAVFYVQFIPVILLATTGITLVWFLGILGVALSSLVMSTALLIATWVTYGRVARRHRAAQAVAK